MVLHHARTLHAFFATLALPGAVLGLRNISIDNNNGRMTYSPSDILSERECKGHPENTDCLGRWWTESGTHETFGPNTSCSFLFQGSSLYLFGVTLDAGARAFARIDDNPATVVDFASPTRGPHHGQLLYHMSDLDPTTSHTFTLEYDSRTFRNGVQTRRWMGIDYLVYTARDDSPDTGDDVSIASAPAAESTDNAGASTAGAAATDEPTDSNISEPSHSGASLNSATLAGIAAGVTCGVVLLLAVPLGCWLMRRHKSRAAPVQNIALKHASGSAETLAQYAFAHPSRASRSSADYAAVANYSGPGTPNPNQLAFARPGEPQYFHPDQRRYSAAFVSSVSSPGIPVDERLEQPDALLEFGEPPPRRNSRPLRFLVHNPDASSHGTVSHVGSDLRH